MLSTYVDVDGVGYAHEYDDGTVYVSQVVVGEFQI
jgi:hypothetical protein